MTNDKWKMENENHSPSRDFHLSRQIQELFYSKIPITRAMGVRVEDYDGEQLIVSAPLDRNINHLGTAFGGSLNALAVLSGYGLLWMELQDPESHIVIRESSIIYERPVRGDIRAICRRPEAETLAEFKQTFHQKGKARIALSATIEDQGVIAARFRGTFVALRQIL
jgi:thioesterase domain-containing protein